MLSSQATGKGTILDASKGSVLARAPSEDTTKAGVNGPV